MTVLTVRNEIAREGTPQSATSALSASSAIIARSICPGRATLRRVPVEDEPLLTTGEAARALGLGRSTITKYVRDGRITPTWQTPGGHARWKLTDLRQQLDALRLSPE
jgi:excisionase family DNA binding protein